MKTLLKVLGIILLIVIILAAATLAILYFTNKNMNPVIDDIPALLAEEPMKPDQRLSFSEKDETMSIILNKSDIYWFITQKYGNDVFKKFEEEAKASQIDVKGYGLNIKPDGIAIDLTGGIDGVDIFLNLSIPCKLDFDGKTFSLIPTGIVAFGKEIPSASEYGIDGTTPLFEIPYTPSLLEGIDKVELVDNGIKVTGLMSVRFCGMARAGFEVKELENMTEDERCSYAAKILLEYANDVDKGKKLWMNILEKDPGLYPTVFRQILSMIKKTAWANYYIEQDNYGFIYRVFPEYNVNSFMEVSEQLHAEYAK